MTFILVQRSNVVLVHGLVYANAGSVQDPKGKTGLAHMFEHMAFKGTATIGSKNFAEERKALDNQDRIMSMIAEERKKAGVNSARLEELKAEFHANEERLGTLMAPDEFINSYRDAGASSSSAKTTRDATTYSVKLPSAALELWFLLESERFYRPVFREFYKEREVVAQERRFRVDNQPQNRLLEELLAASFHGHPYGQPPGGYPRDIEELSRKDAEEFHRLHYCAGNLVAVLSGNLNLDRVKALANIYFERLPRCGSTTDSIATEPEQDAERSVRLLAAGEPVLMLAYKKPAFTHPNNATFELLRAFLADGPSSRLHNRFVTEMRLATRVEAHVDLPGFKYPGLLIVLAWPAPNVSLEQLETSLRDELRHFADREVEEADLDIVRRRLLMQWLDQIESSDQLALGLARFQAVTGSFKSFEDLFTRIKEVTSADLQRVARETFRDNRTTVGKLTGAGGSKAGRNQDAEIHP